MRYGLPYKGSKNGIALWIVNNLPKAETFVDLFCSGGGSHAAVHMGAEDINVATKMGGLDNDSDIK